MKGGHPSFSPNRPAVRKEKIYSRWMERGGHKGLAEGTGRQNSQLPCCSLALMERQQSICHADPRLDDGGGLTGRRRRMRRKKQRRGKRSGRAVVHYTEGRRRGRQNADISKIGFRPVHVWGTNMLCGADLTPRVETTRDANHLKLRATNSRRLPRRDDEVSQGVSMRGQCC